MSDLVTVYQTNDFLKASMVRAFLEQEGIPCLTRNDSVASALGAGPLVSNSPAPFGAIEIQTAASFAPRAAELIQQLDLDTVSSPSTNTTRWSDDLIRGIIILGFLFMFATFGRMAALLAMFTGILLVLIFLLGAPSLRSFLHKQGYTWIGWLDAGTIFFRAQFKAFKLPPASQIEILPGYEPNAASLAAMANQLAAHKKLLRKGSR